VILRSAGAIRRFVIRQLREPRYATGVDRQRPSSALEAPVTITISNLQPLIAILAGILILIAPRLLNYIVAIYLIVVGVIGLGLLRGLT
jgi:hypothetical protein